MDCNSYQRIEGCRVRVVAVEDEWTQMQDHMLQQGRNHDSNVAQRQSTGWMDFGEFNHASFIQLIAWHYTAIS